MFKFSLQALLDHRKRYEEEAQVELAHARRTLADHKKRLKMIIDKERKNIAGLNMAPDVATPVSLIAALIAQGEGLRKNRRKQEESVKEAADHLEGCRNRLVEAMKEKEMLEKLKEKQQKAYLQERMKREVKEFDETGRSRTGKGGAP